MVERIEPRHRFTYVGAQIYVYHANKGQGLPKHDHLYPHATICHSGSCWVRVEGKEILLTKDTQPVDLQANKWHEIEAAEDGTVFANIFEEGKQ